MTENQNEYLDKSLEIIKCYYDIRESESGTWDLADIKKAFGKTQCFRANLWRDGCSLIVGKQKLTTPAQTLPPLDGAMILNVNLRDSDQKRLTRNVEARVGESQENIEAGWEAVKIFLFDLKPAD
ncbi:hypothetical protein Q7C36_001635 [Tachysurus vachellii]|uniref:Uncharacterized protein n=1 Tax=Tachysurus vachellii TaxID=175792 RepID=A0AA88T850_TACVA|nr:hypothetical protein Q7C36_001635 [Tachysurus vachellii]